jgi:hypothetical protein
MGRREQFTVGNLTVTDSIRNSLGGIVASCGADSVYNIFEAGGAITSAGGDTTETIVVPRGNPLWDVAGVGHCVSDDTDNIVSAILTRPITGPVITITGSADPSTAHKYNYLVARKGDFRAFDIVYAGTVTSVGGGAAEAITLKGALATDLGFANYSATDDTDTIAKVIMTADTMTITCSADPLAVHGFHYMVLRPVGLAKPSHYVYKCARVTTVGGAAAEAFTIAGVLADDIPIVGYSVTNDTDTILKTVMSLNTMTITFSADPSTAHAVWYFILRKYPEF